jgi:acyl-CoA synthetase (AMP-forming)/AMP-acid ligase II
MKSPRERGLAAAAGALKIVGPDGETYSFMPGASRGQGAWVVAGYWNKPDETAKTSVNGQQKTGISRA